MARFNMTFSSTGRFNMTFHAGTQTFPMSFGSVVRVGDYELYDGPYSATPSNVAQIIPTSQMLMTENFTVNPSPSNYGLITWDGSVLTVS